MKIPAIRGKIGEWTFYSTILSFRQISDSVEKIDENLHTSNTLNDLIQRSITDNFKAIKDYLLTQENEKFLNSLVLAVYDDYPDWEEIRLSYGEEETYKVGLLSFPGEHKIFPIDGQHRVEGIKASLIENPDLANQEVAVIFIGHKNDAEGKIKTRRLFTTLNRYAKPVKPRDIIALDEDDSVAILTRDLVESHELFQGDRIVDVPKANIPHNNTEAFTSIVRLYDCNRQLLQAFKLQEGGKVLSKTKLNEYLRYRKDDLEYGYYKDYVNSFWNSLKEHFTSINTYVENNGRNKAIAFRNDEGGNLLFRPKGILPFINALIEISKRNNQLLTDIMPTFSNVDLSLSSIPWKRVLWDEINNRMIMNSDSLVKVLFIYIGYPELLTENEVEKLRENYGSKIGLEEAAIARALDDVPQAR